MLYPDSVSADQLSCSGNTANISTSTHATASAVATALRSLTNVSDAAHGAFAITGSGSTAIFTTAGTETSATNLSFTDGTGGAVTSGTPVTGVIPVAENIKVTIGGTVDTGDVYNVVLPGPVTATYTVQPSDTTTTNIANGLGAAIAASAGYSSQAFTVSTSTNTGCIHRKDCRHSFLHKLNCNEWISGCPSSHVHTSFRRIES